MDTEQNSETAGVEKSRHPWKRRVTRWRMVVVTVVVTLVLGVIFRENITGFYSPLFRQVARATQGTDASFNPTTVIAKSFLPIENAKFVDAGEPNHINEQELVLGIEINGQARAYPINMLNGPSREIINDELGGVPIAATW